jgi:hypothetical protein
MNRPSSLAVGGAAALLALVTVALSALGPEVLSQPLVPGMKWVLSALFAFAIALGASYATNRADRTAAAQALANTSTAFVGGPAPLMGRQIAEFGLRPPSGESAPGYPLPGLACVSRGASRWCLWVTGPDDTLTAVAAFTALQAEYGDVRLLAPVDGDGLSTMLRSTEVLRDAFQRVGAADVTGLHKLRAWLSPRRTCAPTVIWLHDLKRFASDLDVEALSEFVERTDPGPGTTLRVLVTMAIGDSASLIAGDDEDALKARRLLVHAEPVEVGVPTVDTKSTAAARPVVEQAAALAAEEESRPLPTAPLLGGGTAALLTASSGLIITVVVLLIIHDGRFTRPPPLAHQASAFVSALQRCERANPGQSTSSVHDGGDWVFPVDASACSRSDYVSVYADDSGHLDLAATERPMSKATWQFSCAEAGHCVLLGGGSRQLIVGSFFRKKKGAQISLPVVLYADRGPRDIRLLAPNLPAPDSQVHSIAVNLSSTAPPDQDSRFTCPIAELCGHPATYITALAADTEPKSTGLRNDVLLIYGDTYNPTTVISRAFALKVTGDDRTIVSFGNEPCLWGTGRSHRAGHHYRKITFASPSALSQPQLLNRLRTTWTGANIRCASVPGAPVTKLPTVPPQRVFATVGR